MPHLHAVHVSFYYLLFMVSVSYNWSNCTLITAYCHLVSATSGPTVIHINYTIQNRYCFCGFFPIFSWLRAFFLTSVCPFFHDVLLYSYVYNILYWYSFHVIRVTSFTRIYVNGHDFSCTSCLSLGQLASPQQEHNSPIVLIYITKCNVSIHIHIYIYVYLYSTYIHIHIYSYTFIFILSTCH